jgi:hypothetical protein
VRRDWNDVADTKRGYFISHQMAVIKKLKFGIHPKHHSRIGTFIECTSVIRQELMESKTTVAFYGPTYLIEDLFEEGCRLIGLSLKLQEGPMCLPFKETEQESLPWKHTSGEVSEHANMAGITPQWLESRTYRRASKVEW